ncbi:MAG: hypothetical protein SWH61_09070 [Thermodesulfobacteriota bacterium]|nr:hypothetical protein [Thermodesulfobacteriota bacterium]
MRHPNKKRLILLVVDFVMVAIGITLPRNLNAYVFLTLSEPAASYSTSFNTDYHNGSSSHKVRFTGIYYNKENHGIVSRYLKALSLELVENSSWYVADYDESNKYVDSDARASWMYQEMLIGGEKVSVARLMRDQAVAASCRAAAETFNATRLGRRIKALEKVLSSYFMIEFSKGKDEAAAHLHLPGDTSMPVETAEKAYGISLGSSFYSSTDSLEGKYALEVEAVYHSCTLNAQYDVGSDKTGFLFENRILNKALGINASLAMIKEADEPPAWVFRVSGKL